MNEEEKKAIEYTENCLMKITMGIDCEFDVNILDALVNIIKKLQKENEELKIKNNAIKRESEAYAEKMIRLDIEKQDYFEKYRYHLQQNESLTKEFSNVIPAQKVKDIIDRIDYDIKKTKEIISKNTNKIPKSTKPRSLTIRSVRLCNSGIYSTARSCSVFPKTRTTSVNTTANKNTIV